MGPTTRDKDGFSWPLENLNHTQGMTKRGIQTGIAKLLSGKKAGDSGWKQELWEDLCKPGDAFTLSLLPWGINQTQGGLGREDDPSTGKYKTLFTDTSCGL